MVFLSKRNKTHTQGVVAILALIVLFIPASVLFSSPVGATTPPTPTTLYTAHAPIVISADSYFDAAHGVTGGTGTATDPYIISGWEIDAGGVDYGIKVSGVTKHFRITNNLIYNASWATIYLREIHAPIARVDNNTLYEAPAGVWMPYVDWAIIENNSINNTALSLYGYWIGAIYLDAAENNTIQYNTITAPFHEGIRAFRSDNTSILHNTVTGDGDYFSINITESDNNIISYNTVNDNVGWAGHAFSLDNSNYNVLYGNSATNNKYAYWTYQSTGNSFIKCYANRSEWYGFYFEQGSRNYVNYSEINENSPVNSGYGIFLQSSNNIAYHNLIRDAHGYGIKSTGSNVIQYNVIENTSLYPIWATSGPNSIMYNAIIDVTNTIYPYSSDTVLHNFFANSTRYDADGDGFSDTPVNYTYGTDEAPLMSTWHPTITITSASDCTASNGIVKGNGTENNPYIIEDYFIDASGATAISVGDSADTMYLTIRNCTVKNGTKGIEATSYGQTFLFENNIIENNYYGVRIVFPHEGIIAKDNIIRYNTYALDIGFKGNLFYHNYIYGNKNIFYNIVPDNTFDNGYPDGGNYWDVYDGVDYYHGINQNLLGPDGIGDTAYVISPYAIDNYPIISLGESQTTLTYDFDFAIYGKTVVCIAKTNINGEIRWNFGDSIGAVGTIVTHEYEENGSYMVTMEIYSNGHTYSKSKLVQIGNQTQTSIRAIIIPLSILNPNLPNIPITQETLLISAGVSVLVIAIGISVPFISTKVRFVLIMGTFILALWLGGII